MTRVRAAYYMAATHRPSHSEPTSLAFLGPAGFESTSHSVFWRAVVRDRAQDVASCRLRRTDWPEGDRCPICLCSKDAMTEPCAVVKCWHAFCRPCIVAWILSRRKALARGDWGGDPAPPPPALPAEMRTPCPLCLTPFVVPVRETAAQAGEGERVVWFEENNDCCFSAPALRLHARREREVAAAEGAAAAAEFAMTLAAAAIVFVETVAEVVEEVAKEALVEREAAGLRAAAASSGGATSVSSSGLQVAAGGRLEGGPRPWDRVDQPAAKRGRLGTSAQPSHS